MRAKILTISIIAVLALTPRTFRIALALLIGGILALTCFLMNSGTPVQASPGIRYVAPGGDCRGATPCYSSVQAAVDAASPGDEIRVAAGTYTGVQNRPALNIPGYFTATQVVAITKPVTIRGGYTTTNWNVSDPVANPTTLDAQGAGRVFCIIGTQVTLEGLRVIGGNSAGLGGDRSWHGELWNVGAGFYILSATVAISNAEIANNTAPTGQSYYEVNFGGGIYARNSQIMLINSRIAGNRGDCTAGVYLRNASGSRILGNVFLNNLAGGGNCYTGGGLSVQDNDILVEKNTFSGNYAYGGGGLGVSGAVIVKDNQIINNRAIYGGGIHLGGGNPVLSGNIIVNNSADQAGGGISMFNCYPPCNPVLVNNVIVNNNTTWSSSWGPGIFIGEDTMTLLHTTIARNTGGDGSGVAVRPFVGASVVTMTNTILVNHSIGISVTAGNTVTVDSILWHNTPITVSQVPGSLVVVQRQYIGDPAFTADGYHISRESAARDRGVDAGVTSDIDGEVRVFGPAPDLGADEWATVTATIEPAAGAVLSATAAGFTTTLQVPAGAVTQSIELRYTARAEAGYAPASAYQFAGQAFDLEAVRGDQPLESFSFERPVTVSVEYQEQARGPVIESTLVLMRWNGSQWEDAACGDYIRNPVANRLEVPLCHLSQFALFGETMRVYLPLVLRNYR